MEQQAQQKEQENLAPILGDTQSKYEIFARLLHSNPAMLSQFFGIGTHAFLDQFFKLWPSFRVQALPYVSIPATVLAGIGWKIGADAIRHPSHEIENEPMNRTFLAIMEGVGAVLPFLIGELIEIYCRNSKHLDPEDRCMVSEETFWKDFFVAPAILSAFYIVWNIIPPAQKYLWLSASKPQKLLVVGVDFLSKMVFYSRILQTFMLNIHSTPQPLLYEGVAAPAALIVLGGEIFKHRHRQKLDAIMSYLMIANLMVYFGFFLESEFAQQSSRTHQASSHLWAPILELSSLSLLFLTGIIFSVSYGKPYLQERGRASGFASRKRYVLPMEQDIAASLQDPQRLEGIIQSILANKRARQKIFEALNQIDQERPIDMASGQIDQERPIDMASIMKNPNYKAIARIIMGEVGFEVAETPDDPNELETVLGDDFPGVNAADVASASRPASAPSRQERAPLLWYSKPSYRTTDDIESGRVPKDAQRPRARSLSSHP